MWILPTKGRPERCQKALDSLVTMGGTQGVVVIGGGDYSNLRTPQGWKIVRYDDSPGICPALNYAFKKLPNEPWYGLWTDDFEARTPGFESLMVEAAGTTGIAAANDLWQGEIPGGKISGCFVIGGDLLREVGGWAPEGLRHSYIDDMWGAIGYSLGVLTYLPEVIVEHLHAWNGKGEDDGLYAKNYAYLDADRKVYEAWLAKDFKEFMARRRVEHIVGKSVWISTPSAAGKLDSRYVTSLVSSIDMANKLGIGIGVHILDKCSILPHARNLLVAEFLASQATHMLFIDDDMGWPPEAIPRLLGYDKPLIAAVGVTKAEDPARRRFCVELDPAITHYDMASGILRVKQVGTGFMMIRRDVLEKMIEGAETLPPPEHNPALGRVARLFAYDFTDTEWGEDYTFCRRWRELGGEVWVDPEIRLDHIGQYSFTGTYLDWLQKRHQAETTNRDTLAA